MCEAEENGLLRREQPFVLGLTAKEIYPESDSDETVLVQGIIDAFFEEEDGLVLMDYKTDHIHEDAKTELTKKYKGQLHYYCLALERLTGKTVKEIWFYAFAKDEEVQIKLTDSEIAEMEIRGYLTLQGEEITLKDGILTMPAKSICILK